MQKQSLSTNITTSTTIGPHIQQALKLLQLSSLDLMDKIDAELAENPFLEIKGEDGDLDSNNEINEQPLEDNYGPLDKKIDDNLSSNSTQDTNIEDIFEDSSDFGYLKKSNDGIDVNSKQSYMENAIPVTVNIYDHLMTQLSLAEVSDNIYTIAEAIISSLDPDGYFKIQISDFASSMNFSEQDVLEALKLVQSFEPLGIGSRDLQECLLIQVLNMDVSPVVIKIIQDDFKYLEKKKYKELSTKLNITENELREHLKIISNLEPIPTRQFDTKKIKYIVPDIIVQKVEGGFSISVNDDYIPSLRINKFYKKVLKTEKMTGEVKTFLSDKYNDARLLILSLSRRKSTMYLVMEKILELQKDFFMFGPQNLKPLTLNDVAEGVEMHMSTISRVTRDKYVDTPWGIFELKYFFSNSIKNENGNIKAAQSVKEIIKRIIEHETSGKKLSDQKIADILTNQGINISRRTVAKYRKNLKILSSYDRKI